MTPMLALMAKVMAALVLFAGAASPARAQATALATFAGGCFWCTESDFDKIPGLISTTSGYIGGSVANPTYQQVSAKTTGHAEAVQIVLDPAKVSYEQLLAKFWASINPTTRDGTPKAMRSRLPGSSACVRCASFVGRSRSRRHTRRRRLRSAGPARGGALS